MSNYHIPVMLKEVLEYLEVKPGEWYVDCNLGGGGHTEGILKAGGKVIGIDLDQDALAEVAKKHGLALDAGSELILAQSENLILVHANFAEIKQIIKQVQDDTFGEMKIAGILYDLGVSSYQLETAERGFSFNTDAPLDMRMDQSKQTATAADLVNGLHEGELSELFWKLGEDRFSRQIAKKIVIERKKGLITTTNQLAKVIISVRPRGRTDRTHPATRVFQALRIAVNDELNSLKMSLPDAFEILKPGGRMVIISFHSLEDRIAKEFMRGMQDKGEGKVVTKKPLEPTEQEVLANPRARSGKFRVLVKI